MPDRLPINSESLKARFPEVYREFFSKCAIVCSASRTIAWAGDHVGRYGGLVMRQQLPFRTYVGIVPRKDRRCSVEQYIAYDPALQQFHELQSHFDEIHRQRIEEDLLLFMEKICGLKPQGGFDILVLSELPLEHALGSVGALFVPLWCSIFLLHRILTKEHIASWKGKKCVDLISDKQVKFDEIFRMIWKWETLNHSSASGANVFCDMTPSSTPLLYSQWRPETTDELKDKILKNRLTIDDLSFMDSAQYWGARTVDLWGEHIGWPWPFDFGIISPGAFRSIHDVISSLHMAKEEIFSVTQEIVKMSKPFLGEIRNNVVPSFYKICLSEGRTFLYEYHASTLHVLAFQMIIIMKEIIEQGFAEERIKKLTAILNRVHHAILSIAPAPTHPETTMILLKKFVETKIGDGAIGVKLDSDARAYHLLFLTPRHALRKWIGEIFETFKSEIHEKVSLDYASWIDGYEEEGGVKVEQFIEEGIHSPLLEGGSLRLTRWGKKGETSTTIIQPTDIKKEAFDILFDGVHEKLYVKGKECTSDDLPSQKTTVEILSLLMTTEGHRLHNKMLPQSSYASYRNELQGKIVGPLTALVEKRLKRELQLKIDGTLTDFWISLDPKGFSIGLIKKLQ